MIEQPQKVQARQAYDTLYGMILSLQVETAAKAVFMEHLKYLYEHAQRHIGDIDK